MPARLVVLLLLVALVGPLPAATGQGQPGCTHTSTGGDLGEETSWSPGRPDIGDHACLLSGVGTVEPGGENFQVVATFLVAEGAELRVFAGDGLAEDAVVTAAEGDIVNRGTIVLSSCAGGPATCDGTPDGTTGRGRFASLRAAGTVVNEGAMRLERGIGATAQIGNAFVNRGVLDVDASYVELFTSTLESGSATRVAAGAWAQVRLGEPLLVEGRVEADGWFTAPSGPFTLGRTAEVGGLLGIEAFGSTIALEEGARGLVRVLSNPTTITTDVPEGIHLQAVADRFAGGQPGGQPSIILEGANRGRITLDTASRAAILRPGGDQRTFDNLGVIDGSGAIIGMVNHGVLSPGPGVAPMSLQPGFTQSPTGLLALDVGAAGSDVLLVTGGEAALDGRVHVTGVPGDLPAAGSTVQLVQADGGASGSLAVPAAVGTLTLDRTGATLVVGEGLRPGSAPPTRWTTLPDATSLVRGDEAVSNVDLAARLAVLGGAALAGASRFTQVDGPTVLLGREDVFADAVASGGLQGDAVLLLVPRAGPLPESVRGALADLRASRVVILGGEAAVTAAVAEEVAALGFPVERLAGASRFETATAIAGRLPSADTALLVRAFPSAGAGDQTQAFADSIAAGGLAAENGWPILLTDTASLNPSTAAYLDAAPIRRVLVLGGTAAVSEDVVGALRERGLVVERIAGDSRAGTAIEVARIRGEASDPQSTILVDGQAPDGWVAGFASAALSGATGAPIVLAAGGNLPPQTVSFLDGFTSPPTLVCASSAEACADARVAAGLPPAEGVGLVPDPGSTVAAGQDLRVTTTTPATIDGTCLDGAVGAEPGTTTVTVRAAPPVPTCTLRVSAREGGQVDHATFSTAG